MKHRLFLVLALLSCALGLGAQSVEEKRTSARPQMEFVSQTEKHGSGALADSAGLFADIALTLGTETSIGTWPGAETQKNHDVRIDLGGDDWTLSVNSRTTVTAVSGPDASEENRENGPIEETVPAEEEYKGEQGEQKENPAMSAGQEQSVPEAPQVQKNRFHRISVGAGYSIQNVGVAGIVRVSSGHGWGGKVSYSYFLYPHLLIGADFSYNRFSYEKYEFTQPYEVFTLMPRLGSAFSLTPHMTLELDFGLGADYRAFDDQRGVFPAGGLFVSLVYKISDLVSLSAGADAKVALQQVMNPAEAEVDVYVQAGLAVGFSF